MDRVGAALFLGGTLERKHRGVFAAITAAAVLCGCNSVLGFQDGIPYTPDAGPADDAPTVDAATIDKSPIDEGRADAAGAGGNSLQSDAAAEGKRVAEHFEVAVRR
jgi:hypothetical protein